MKVNAIYHHRVEDDGREVHGIDHDGGSFSVSSAEVGIAVQNFLHYATELDILTLHSHLLYAFAHKQIEGLLSTPSYVEQRRQFTGRDENLDDD